MNYFSLLVLFFAFAGVSFSQDADPAPPSTEDLVAAAEDVLEEARRDNVSAAGKAGAIFEAAHRLWEEEELDKAEDYFARGLQLAPWEMEHQLAFARVLQAKENTEKAASVARIVFETSERQELLEESARIADLDLPPELPPLPPEPPAEKAFCFVRVGPVDDWIIRHSGRDLSEKLGTAVYLHPEEIELPAPHRSYYDRWAENLKDGIVWEHEYIQQEMRDIGVESRESASVDQTLELHARIAEGQGHDDPRPGFQQLKAEVKERDPQWDAIILLDRLQSAVPPRENVVFVAITAGDIYAQDKNYLFGIAPTGSGYCLSSYRRFTAWFHQERENQERLLSRIHKQLLSSVGLALDIPRPTDPRSARSYPNGIQDVDLKGEWLAEECIDAFEKALGRPLPKATREESKRARNS